MSQTSHLDGPALRALASAGGRPAFLPPDTAEAAPKERDRIWDLADNLHCSIVGTCLTNADGRSLLAKLGVPDARSMSEHRLHGQVVQLAGRRDGGGRLLQKMLDRRHEAEIRRFEKARTAGEVRALWRASLERGEIPGAYWAAITHPATDWPLVQDIFGEVHMLSHLVGQSNRADIRRLRQLEEGLAARDETIAAQERRILDLMAQRDGLDARRRAAEAARPSAAGLPAQRAREPERATALEARLARERAHAEALEEKVAMLVRATSRLACDLAAEAARGQALEAELSALEGTLTDGGDPRPEAHVLRLDGRVLLYVGGRPRQVANLRRYAAGRGGRLLTHDGGIEDSTALLPGLVGQSECVLFPVACVSHEAAALVKRACEAAGKPFRPLRSAGLASFVAALARTPP